MSDHDHPPEDAPDTTEALDPDSESYDRFLAHGKRSTTRERPDLSDKDIVALAKSNMLRAFQGDDPETAAYIERSLREIIDDKKSRQRLNAIKQYAEYMQGITAAEPSGKPTINIGSATLSPQLLDALEAQVEAEQLAPDNEK